VTSETIVILRNLRTENDYSQNPKARRIDVATRSCTVALANINCRMKGVNERHDPSRKLPTLPAWRTAAGEITMILSICSSTVPLKWPWVWICRLWRCEWWRRQWCVVQPLNPDAFQSPSLLCHRYTNTHKRSHAVARKPRDASVNYDPYVSNTIK